MSLPAKPEAGEGVRSEFATLHEFVEAASVKLPASAWNFLIGGAETETTVLRNRQSLDSLAFRPRVLRNVASVDPSGSLFGKRLRLPVLLAPIGGLQGFEPGGGATVVRGASAFGTGMIMSSASQPGLEEVAAAGPCPKVFQLYVRGDQAWCDDHLRRAEGCGYDAFCVTVDTAHFSRRERGLAGRPLMPPTDDYQSALSWEQIKRFRERLRIPLILKGIATAEDATLACELGVDGVYVSNHGGRQLDHGRGAIEVLPEVVAAVGGRARVFVDGGFSRGTDVVKAIILGADAVGIGRLYCYGLAAAGAEGVCRVLEILEDEIIRTLGQLGVASFADLDLSYLYAAAPVSPPHVHSAFPLLSLEHPGDVAP
ncbi:MAG TPA: alpha-hydroxy acid oxidase [Candidatus Dormibacteraeota bacterium]|nr:alpha-hydroxy acid oxidase [Candidatus Dormibacteraeota bacterium]